MYPYLQRRVARDQIGDVTVSTVFLGDLYPDTWETMVFGEDHPMDKYIKHYGSEAAALDGHAKILELVRRGRAAPTRLFLEDHDSV